MGLAYSCAEMVWYPRDTIEALSSVFFSRFELALLANILTSGGDCPANLGNMACAPPPGEQPPRAPRRRDAPSRAAPGTPSGGHQPTGHQRCLNYLNCGLETAILGSKIGMKIAFCSPILQPHAVSPASQAPRRSPAHMTRYYRLLLGKHNFGPHV